MKRYAFLILFLLFPVPVLAGFVLDPNSGSYFSTDTPPRPKAETASEKKAAAEYNATLNTALADYNKYFRFYRYWFLGAGAKSGKVEQGGNTSSQNIGLTGTAGIDFDGLTWPVPYTFEVRGTFGFGPPTGETTVMWYVGLPISRAWVNRSLSVPCPVDQDVRRGIPFGQAVLDHGSEIEDWAKQFSPIRIELGIGYQGVSYEADGGTVLDGGTVTRGTTTGMVAGLAYAGRIGYFGEQNMLRLTGYYLSSSKAKTGTKFTDGVFPNTEVEIEDTVKGRVLSAKVDWYRRLDERVRKGAWISGYGVSLLGRKIHLDEGVTSSWRGGIPGGGEVVTVFPAQDATQVEFLVTVGYLR